MSLPLLRFSLGPHLCGFNISEVREVLRIAAITPLPKAPAFVEGVINLRGDIIPVIDMRKRLGFEPGAYTFPNRILITSLHGHTAGLIVDEVSGVAQIEQAEMGIDPSEELCMNLHRYVSRVVREGEQLLMVIDPATILTEEETSTFAAAASAPQPEEHGK